MHEFKDLSRITAVATITVGVYMLADILTTSAIFMFGTSAPEEFGLADLLALPQVLLLFASVILVGRWTYRASANAHAMSGNMAISPGWAVGWYFVPIANLFKPFQAMKEIWLASHRTGAESESNGMAILGWWWGLWLLSNVLGNITFRMEMSGTTDPQSLTTAYLVSTAINIPLCIILIMIMRLIANAQRGNVYEEVFA